MTRPRRYGLAQVEPGVYLLDGHRLWRAGTAVDGRWRITTPDGRRVTDVPDATARDLESVARWLLDEHLPECRCHRPPSAVLDLDGDTITEWAVQHRAADESVTTSSWYPNEIYARDIYRVLVDAHPAGRYRLVSRTVSRTMVHAAVPNTVEWYR